MKLQRDRSMCGSIQPGKRELAAEDKYIKNIWRKKDEQTTKKSEAC